MNRLIKQLNLSKLSLSWIYYGSLVGIVLLSYSSQFLSNIALKEYTSFIGSIGIFTIVQYSLMAIFMLLAWFTSSQTSSLKDYKWILITAFVVRIVLIDVEPYTSNDSSRYLFDGRIAYEGFDPYSIRHDDEALVELRQQWQPPSEHASYVTIYPPLALALFSFASSFGVDNAELAWKYLLFFAGLLTVWVSALVLQRAGKLENLALVALSPLLILETGVGLHIDAFSALAVVIALYCWQRQLLMLCGVVIGLGMALKVLPVMLLLPLLLIQKTFKNAFVLIFGWLITVAVIYSFTTFVLGFVPVGSIGVFFEKWRNAAPIFTTLDTILTSEQIVLVLLIIAMTTVLTITYISFKQGKYINTNTHVIYACMQASLALPLILSPVLFPWYLLPLVPLFALRPNIPLLAWLIAMPLTYEVLGDFLCCNQWQPAFWPTIILGIIYSLTTLKIIHYGMTYFNSKRDAHILKETYSSRIEK